MFESTVQQLHISFLFFSVDAVLHLKSKSLIQMQLYYKPLGVV